MDNNFIPYDFNGKTIRVKYDAEKDRNWFVIKDVLFTYDWESWKLKMEAAGMTSPSAFVTYVTEQGAIDLANRRQMLQIINFIKPRNDLKEYIEIWLNSFQENDQYIENDTTFHTIDTYTNHTKENKNEEVDDNEFPEYLDQYQFCSNEQIDSEINPGIDPEIDPEIIPGIIDVLTEFALSDRVLTDLERKTIIKKATEIGISSEEINKYLDEQLSQRLKSYTKVELRDCPYCGAQIPLISDECRYCGKPLEHIEGNYIYNKSFYIDGTEADIIRKENQRVEQERHNIKNCPDCGAPFPLISNICPSCGHVLHERNDNKLNINKLITNMQWSIDSVNNAPKPKVHQIIGYWFYYILLLLSVFTFTVAIIFHSEIGKVLSMVGFGISFIAILFARKTIKDSNTPAQIADGEYYKARYAYEMYARQVETLYGDDHEAKQLLNEFAMVIKRLKRERYKNRKRVTIIICIISLIIMSICAFFGSQKYHIKQTQQLPTINYKSLPREGVNALNLSKKLKPYPPTTGVNAGLDAYLIANKGAELTCVAFNTHYYPIFHWKVNKLELMSTGTINDNPFYQDNTIQILLLDKHLQIIQRLSYSTENFNHINIIANGKGHYFTDFWSKYGTASEPIITSIINKATYYTIIMSNADLNTNKQ